MCLSLTTHFFPFLYAFIIHKCGSAHHPLLPFDTYSKQTKNLYTWMAFNFAFSYTQEQNFKLPLLVARSQTHAQRQKNKRFISFAVALCHPIFSCFRFVFLVIRTLCFGNSIGRITRLLHRHNVRWHTNCVCVNAFDCVNLILFVIVFSQQPAGIDSWT